ncbi:hypothetical protein [Sandarakinorhabdus sp.]|uniref:hypothetical protein n=1 Tax=Sandarakinorhabdus sp. TaxID=1916663 RepID=UPI00286E02A1|nr:hypothetical protein [Sandarakinorhabdus sp.]
MQRLLVLFALASSQPMIAGPVPVQVATTDEPRYLAFQLFTSSPDTATPMGGERMLGPPPPPAEIDRFVVRLAQRIGSTGTPRRRLAIILGPLAFDQTDAQVLALIASAFDIALRRGVAVGFHIDDAMYWGRRRSLVSDPRNVERTGWDGPLSTGRRLDWGPQPSRAPPQLCLNSPAVEAAVQSRGRLIGAAIGKGIDRLRRAGRADLFAGVIAGWESQIGRDFETGRSLGYCALANRGLRRGASVAALDQGRINAVARFIGLWSGAIAASGVDPSRIYSHIAFVPRSIFDPTQAAGRTYAATTSFSPLASAFGPGHRAGFSTYPAPRMIEDIQSETRRRGGAPWASAEGANVALGGDPTPSGMTTETYLARLFNHGAALVNLFGWGMGPPANGFRQTTEGPEAIAAYRKFLSGAPLVEGPVRPSILQRLPAKIHRIQAQLPAWVSAHGDEARVRRWMEALDKALKANDLATAEAQADALLALLARN